jgi:S1-C subfamily serine protease
VSDRIPRPRVLAGIAAGAGLMLLGGGIGAAIYAAGNSGTTTIVRETASPAPTARAVSSGLSINDIYRSAAPGVVQITVDEGSSSGNGFPFGGGQTQQAQGTGFVYDTNGDIITNAHVVSGASAIHVAFQDGSSYSAKLVGTDPSTDLAVIRVSAPGSKLHPLSLGNSDTIEVGDGVVAIGSPFGLPETVTSGIVSALHRQISAPDNFPINDAIQTDAAINHGNSGGPLLNDAGKVIGVTSQIESDSGGNDGVGFAIPSNTVKSVASSLIANGKVEHAYLGVGVATIPSSVAGQLNVAAGVAVTDVRSGTPAASAGLKAATGSRTVGGNQYPTGGDVITEFAGTKVTTAEQLQNLVAAKQPGETVTLKVSRGGSTRTVTLKLANRPS